MSRGHPLVALLAVLGGWIGGRVATWETPSAEAFQVAAAPPLAENEQGFVADRRAGPLSLPDNPAQYADPGRPADISDPRYVLVAPPTAVGWSRGGGFPSLEAGPGLRPRFWPLARHLGDEFAGVEALPRFFAPEVAGSVAAPARSSHAEPTVSHPRRWSADAWALLRRDDASALTSPGALPATYGASQAGAVLRYRLALASRYRAALYMRTTSSMGQLRETSAALGISARPLPSFPVIAAMEGRLTQQGGKSRFQPAVMAVTQLPPFALPGGFLGDAYAQGGYIAGSFSTLFADGQFRADRSLFDVGAVQTRIGGGIWGGVQRGAARLDAGPSASVAMPLGKGTRGRVAIDWRFRVAGDAVPDSGPALTLSAGF